MNQYLKSYHAVLHTVGPVFIGSGKEIGKKEYLFLNGRQAGILDIQKFYQEMSSRKKAAELEAYLLGNGNYDLNVWLRKQKIKADEVRQMLRYTLDCADEVIECARKPQVMECMKDAYGYPYVPGSSLKGMLRTVLLGNDLIRNPAKYQKGRAALKRNAQIKASRNSYLNRDVSRIEGAAFCTLKREHSKPDDAVNDVLQGLRVSDSEPLPLSSLVLCQSVELHTNGEEKTLPLLRECIMPGTDIPFTITVDTSVCSLTAQALMDAVKNFAGHYYHTFASAFPGAAASNENTVYLGGGCGFASKTAIYPMYGKQEGIETTQQILKITLGKNFVIHKHNRDRQLGASPHILKCTKYQGKTLQMGMCSVQNIIPERAGFHAT